MSELRPLTHAEAAEAIDPDAWTTAPLPKNQGDLNNHRIDCTCVFCIPGFDDNDQEK